MQQFIIVSERLSIKLTLQLIRINQEVGWAEEWVIGYCEVPVEIAQGSLKFYKLPLG